MQATIDRLPRLIIGGLSVRDYAYQWIQGGCPLHQWCSGARGIDHGVIRHVEFLVRMVRAEDVGNERLDGRSHDPADVGGLNALLMYLQMNIGHAAEPYIPDEFTRDDLERE